MEIKYPSVRRDLPAEGRVIEVILALCQKCGYDERHITLQYIGGDRYNSFSKAGVRLIKPSPFSVNMYIGCGKQTVEALFQLKNREGRAVSGDNLFQAMETTFGGRIFLVEAPKPKDVSPAAPVPPAPPSEPEPLGKVSEAVQEVSPEAASATLAKASAPNFETDYAGYFHNEVHLQLAVLALVTKFRVDEPFGFDDFTEALCSESKLVFPSNVMAPTVRIFIGRGYITKLTKRSPVRYVLTEEAVAFASAPTPPSPAGEADQKSAPRAKPAEASAAETAPPATPEKIDPFSLLKALKRDEEAYQKKLQAIRDLEEEVSRTDVSKLASEEETLRNETLSLNRRLKAISGRLEEIGNIRTARDSAQAKVGELTTDASFVALTKRHNEYENARKLLLGDMGG